MVTKLRVLESKFGWGAMNDRRNLLAVKTIAVTFAAALDSLARSPTDRDVRVLMAEQARDRALQLLDGITKVVPYEPDSPLDRAIREAQGRIEAPVVPREQSEVERPSQQTVN